MVNLVKRNGKVITSEPSPEQAVRIIAGRYRLGQQLGKGGNARVYHATDLKNNSTVAVKLFFRELERDPSFVARFRKEVKIATSLRHENIVRTLDYGYDDGRYYLVMDYIEGCNLQDLVNRHGQMGLGQVVALVGQLCDALHYAHNQGIGIIHRDIKPQNVLVDKRQHVRLGDFGLARAIANTGLTVTGPTIGTIGYLAPEQIQNAPLTARTDIYALGVMMFVMVTGRLPFENTSALAVALAHVQQEAPLPRVHNPQVSPSLELVIRRCMAKDPARRFASVLELKSSLIDCLTDEAIYKNATPLALEFNLAEPTTPKPAEQTTDLEDVISLPTAAIRDLGVIQPKVAPVPARSASHERETDSHNFGDVTSEHAFADENTPFQRPNHSLTTAFMFRYKSKKARMAVGVMVGMALALVSLLAIVGFSLVSQAREQATTVEASINITTAPAISSTAAATIGSSTKPPTVAVGTIGPNIGISVTPGLKVGGTLSGANLWRVQDSPVTVTQDLVIGTGATLTIEPGVTVKVATNVNIRVEGGKLQAIGTAAQPILFTSAQEQPTAGDWGGIIVNNNGTIQLTQVELRYGGSAKAPLFDPKHPALLVTGGRIEMTASKISQSDGAGLIILNKSTGFVTTSTFTNNVGYHVYLDSKAVTLTNNQPDPNAKVKQ